jgi:hypothetical protein
MPRRQFSFVFSKQLAYTSKRLKAGDGHGLCCIWQTGNLFEEQPR